MNSLLNKVVTISYWYCKNNFQFHLLCIEIIRNNNSSMEYYKPLFFETNSNEDRFRRLYNLIDNVIRYYRASFSTKPE